MVDRSHSKIQEQLVSLYLRLNGCFVTGFVVHSPVHGSNRTEIDALALRHPFSSEPERMIGPDPRLDLSTSHTDLMICEVKSRGQKLQFNSPLKTQPDVLASVLRWCGLFKENDLRGLATALSGQLLAGHPNVTAPPTVHGPRNTRVRALMFSPERTSRRDSQRWFLTGPEIIEYVWRCLCPGSPRSSCATTYDFQVWGDFEPIVRYFKTLNGKQPGGLQDIYAFLDAPRK